MDLKSRIGRPGEWTTVQVHERFLNGETCTWHGCWWIEELASTVC
jgi:hypothetical protein